MMVNQIMVICDKGVYPCLKTNVDLSSASLTMFLIFIVNVRCLDRLIDRWQEQTKYRRQPMPKSLGGKLYDLVSK